MTVMTDSGEQYRVIPVGELPQPHLFPQQYRGCLPLFQVPGMMVNVEAPDEGDYLLVLPVGSHPAAGRFYAVHPSRMGPGLEFPVAPCVVHWLQLGPYWMLDETLRQDPPTAKTKREWLAERERFISVHLAGYEGQLFHLSWVTVLGPDPEAEPAQGHLYFSAKRGKFLFQPWSSGGGEERFIRAEE